MSNEDLGTPLVSSIFQIFQRCIRVLPQTPGFSHLMSGFGGGQRGGQVACESWPHHRPAGHPGHITYLSKPVFSTAMYFGRRFCLPCRAGKMKWDDFVKGIQYVSSLSRQR